MTNKPTHTPTPWKHHLGRGKYPRFHIQTMGGYQIASTPKLDSLSKEQNEGREHDAAFIVRAVNVHEELLQVVKDLRYRSFDVTFKGWDFKKLEHIIAKAEWKVA